MGINHIQQLKHLYQTKNIKLDPAIKVPLSN